MENAFTDHWASIIERDFLIFKNNCYAYGYSDDKIEDLLMELIEKTSLLPILEKRKTYNNGSNIRKGNKRSDH